MSAPSTSTLGELARSIQQIDQIDVDDFSRMVRAAPATDLTGVLAEHRGAILDEIFRQMPERVRPERIDGVEGLLRWRISGRPDGGDDVYEIAIRDGACSMHKGETDASPRTTMIVDPVSFVRLMAQATSPMKLVLRRRIRVKGDVAFAMRSESFFRKPLDET
jgi:hypothetical protein